MVEIDYKGKFNEFKFYFFKSRKYWLIYLIFLIITALAMFVLPNYHHPKIELISVILIAIVGIFSITFYSYHNSDENIHKTVFVIIILFGLLCCFLNPICNVSDESEHLARADITSQGILNPGYVHDSFYVSSSVSFFESNRSLTAFQVDGNMPYDDTLVPYHSAFQQNPFYGYLPQAIGLMFAKVFDLSVMWAMWLGRIFNLLLYATLVSFAVKKSPILKVPIIVTACIPVAIQQAASFSIDSLFIGLGIYICAYFFYMVKVEDYTLENKDILLFSALCLVFGLCRLPALASVLLLFLVPSKKFKSYNSKLFKFIGLFLVLLVGIIFASHAMPNTMHSWRLSFSTQRHFNSTEQLNYMISHPADSLVAIFHFINGLENGPILSALVNLYSTAPGNTALHNLGFISAIYPLFIGAVWLFYPQLEKFDFKTRIGSLVVVTIIYFATYLIQTLTWSPVGDLYSAAVHARYFLPFFVLIPFIFGINHTRERNKELDKYIICLTCCFIASFLIQITARYY